MRLTTGIILLDQLTKEFFSHAFPGFNRAISAESNLRRTNVPVLEVPLNIDTDFLLQTIISESTTPIQRSVYPYETKPRLANWDLAVLWNNYSESFYIEDIYHKKSAKPTAPKLASGRSLVIQKYFEDVGLTVKNCMLSIFHPGGYVRPHRDINLSVYPLNYFWLPLNNPKGSELKVYPYGTVLVNLGSIYLLNHENFVHGVINQSDQKRYAILGYIEQWSDNINEVAEISLRENYSCVL